MKFAGTKSAHPLVRAAAVFTLTFTATAFAAVDAPSSNREHRSPSSDEMSPTQWRAKQLEAADKSDKIMHEAQKLPGLLAQYLHMQLHYDTNRDRAFQLIFGQYLSWFQTYIGDYDGARKSFSIAQPPQGDDGPSPLAGGYTAKPAAEVILELAKGRKAVFFNEAHSAPLTRTLTIELLAKLRAQGFNYFAAETLYTTDADLQKRGYPTAASGFYTNEPMYAEMVRTALKLGYTVLAYDAENAGIGDPRERAGAENLYTRVFKHDPNARLVVNAGFAHVQKSGKYLGGTSMGDNFHKISGIDPLTIEQTMMIEHARNDQDHPFYRQIVDAKNPAQPIVYMSADGKPWTLKPGKYDISVVFPSQVVDSGRPTWPSLDGLRQPYSISGDLCHNTFPCLIEARYASEGDDSIPADRALLNVIDDKAALSDRILAGHGSAVGRLYLRPGQYRLIATDRANHVLFSKDVSIAGDK